VLSGHSVFLISIIGDRNFFIEADQEILKGGTNQKYDPDILKLKGIQVKHFKLQIKTFKKS